jgi:hypothetical protein
MPVFSKMTPDKACERQAAASCGLQAYEITPHAGVGRVWIVKLLQGHHRLEGFPETPNGPCPGGAAGPLCKIYPDPPVKVKKRKTSLDRPVVNC